MKNNHDTIPIENFASINLSGDEGATCMECYNELSNCSCATCMECYYPLTLCTCSEDSSSSSSSDSGSSSLSDSTSDSSQSSSSSIIKQKCTCGIDLTLIGNNPYHDSVNHPCLCGQAQCSCICCDFCKERFPRCEECKCGLVWCQHDQTLEKCPNCFRFVACDDCKCCPACHTYRNPPHRKCNKCERYSCEHNIASNTGCPQ